MKLTAERAVIVKMAMSFCSSIKILGFAVYFPIIRKIT
jgi:hypothetical protein